MLINNKQTKKCKITKSLLWIQPITLLEISLFTRVVYPQYMEQLIVCYFSSFSVNLLGLSDTTVLTIYCDILTVSISRYFVINYRDTRPVHYCH